jgi:aminoacrylate hydrolase
MATLDAQGITQYYELHGDASAEPVLMLTGLGGISTSWGPQIPRFSEKYHVILPDQRGTGRTTHTLEGLTTEQLGEDVATLVEYLDLGPVHVVGASTGGAIGQHLTLNHPDLVRSLTMSGSFARFDDYARREFKVRRSLLVEADRDTIFSAYACFLFSPRYTRANPEMVQGWVDRLANQPGVPEDKEIAIKRIDMVAGHDTFSRLGTITQPVLVICGEHDFCVPVPLSEDMASVIPGAKLVVLEDAGHLIEVEKDEEFFETISQFIESV